MLARRVRVQSGPQPIKVRVADFDAPLPPDNLVILGGSSAAIVVSLAGLRADREIAGASINSSISSGRADVARGLTGISTVASLSQGGLVAEKGLSGSSEARAVSQASIVTAGGFGGLSQVNTQSQASLEAARRVAGESDAVSVSTGDVEVIRNASGSSVASAISTAWLAVTREISALSAAVSQSLAGLAVSRSVGGQSNAAGVSTAVLSVSRQASGLSAATAVSGAALTVGGGAPAVFTDDFNRANESLGSSANWTRIDGTTSALVVDNNMLASATTAETTYLSPDLGALNHYVEGTLRLVGANGPFMLCRATNLNNWVGVRNSAAQYQCFKRVNGTLTQVGVSSAITPAVGDRMRLEVNGDTAVFSINGSVHAPMSAMPLGTDVPASTRQGVIARTSIRNPWIDDYKAGVL